jgi:ornithine decarboxylase
MSKPTFNRSFIDAITRLEIVETPYMLTDLDIVLKNSQNFHKYLPNVDLLYAVKAMYSQEIVNVLKNHVQGFDVASIGEINDLISYGIPAARLYYSNPVKSVSSIITASKLGIKKFTYQSKSELEKIQQHVPNAEVILRVKVNDSHSLVPLSHKFGVTPDDAVGLLVAAQKMGLKPVGVTFHVGSQLLDVEIWEGAIRTAEKIVSIANKEKGLELTTINIGGGFPTKYFESDEDITQTALHINTIIEKSNIPIKYVAEPGRYIVADSSVIVSEVIGVEQRNNTKWVFIDTGLYQSFLGAARYEVFPYIPISLSHYGLEATNMTEVTLTGPSCDSQDIIATNINLPDDIKTGDRLIFPNTGAYTTVYGSRFNGFNVPKQFFINGASSL